MQISIDEFLKKRKETKPSAFVFDLRDMDEYEEEHLLAAYNLPSEHFEASMTRLPFNGDLLFYDGGNSAAELADVTLKDNGFSDFYFVSEGYESIKKALKNSPYDIKLLTSKDDPKEVQMEVIQNLLEFEINPKVAAHGGFFTLLDVKDNNVYVELGGGCQGCGMADVTLRQGVEQRMKEVFPDMIALIDNTDHAGGDNPYYQPGK